MSAPLQFLSDDNISVSNKDDITPMFKHENNGGGQYQGGIAPSLGQNGGPLIPRWDTRDHSDGRDKTEFTMKAMQNKETANAILALIGEEGLPCLSDNNGNNKNADVGKNDEGESSNSWLNSNLKSEMPT